jgi:trk system potassium uptake protein TrkA
MKVIVMGCGRIGSQVSQLLSDQGHEVMVIDHDANSEGRLGPHFKGSIIKGLGFDRKILEQAGIEQAEAFVAASQSDNANIVAARIARNIFHVPRVVARLYDPRRAEIYQRLGLTTISSTNWGAERIFQVLTHTDIDVWNSFGNGEVTLVHVELPPQLTGRNVQMINVPGEIMVVSITRNDRAFIPTSGTEFHEGDLVNLVVLSSALNRLEDLFGMEGR